MPAYWKDVMVRCEICQCWYRNNKASKSHHERGNRHKANVEAKIKEIGKKASAKEAEQKELLKTLQAMEDGAQKSAKSDSIMSPALAAAYDGRPPPKAHLATTAGVRKAVVRPAYTGSVLPESAKAVMGTKCDEQRMWVEAISDETGQTYYWNAITGVTSWERPTEGYYTVAEWDELNNKTLNERQCTSGPAAGQGGSQVQVALAPPPAAYAAQYIQGECARAPAPSDEDMRDAVATQQRVAGGAVASIFGSYTSSSTGYRGVAEVAEPDKSSSRPVMHASDVAPIPACVAVEEMERRLAKERLRKVQLAAKDGANSAAAGKAPKSELSKEYEPSEKKTKGSHPYGSWTAVEKEPTPEGDLELPASSRFVGDQRRLEELDELDSRARELDADDECRFEEKKPLNFSVKPSKKSKVVVFKKRKNFTGNTRSRGGD